MKKCPKCSELVPGAAQSCEHCGAELPRGGGVSLALIVVLAIGGMCLCFVPIVAAIAIPNLIEARKHGNEAAAIGALRTINTAQSLFREGDKENDGIFDYGSLAELGEAQIIDGVLASGTKQGYVFECRPSSQTPEFLWMAVARPAVPGTTGDRYFVINQAGVVGYSVDQPLEIDDLNCEFPDHAMTVSR